MTVAKYPGCPMKQESSKTTLISIVTFSCEKTVTWEITTKCSWFWHLIQTSILLNKTKICPKFFISPVIMYWKHKNTRPHFRNAKTRDIIWLLNLEFTLKLGLQISVENYFKDQRRPSSRLPTVMCRIYFYLLAQRIQYQLATRFCIHNSELG